MNHADRTGPGTVSAIHVAPEAGADVRARERVDAVAGRGLRGDRYFAGDGTYSASARDVSREITLIESETLAVLEREAGIELPPGAHRRNVTTRGIALDRLVGERFRVGGAVCEGVELCEPCSYLERLLGIDGLYDALVHRGGIRARIVESGSIAVGNEVAARGNRTRPRSKPLRPTNDDLAYACPRRQILPGPGSTSPEGRTPDARTPQPRSKRQPLIERSGRTVERKR